MTKKKRQVHNDWLESFDWGTRCLHCGRVRTDRAKAIDEKMRKIAERGLAILYMSLLTSVLVLMIWHPHIVSELMKVAHRASTQLSDTAFWFIVYCGTAIYVGWILRRFFPERTT